MPKPVLQKTNQFKKILEKTLFNEKFINLKITKKIIRILNIQFVNLFCTVYFFINFI